MTPLLSRVFVALVAALALAACSAQKLTGTFELTDDKVVVATTDCHGSGGYSDIRPGLGVVVKDGTGKTIATTSLVHDAANSGTGKCAYTFAVEIPSSDFYSVEVGHRGALTYSRAELGARGWAVGFTLGR